MKILIHNPYIINRGLIFKGSVLIENEIIKEIFINNLPKETPLDWKIINAENLYLIPGVIDDQVHFREPGLTYKGDIESESAAAVAGGITSFLEMPNTKPPTCSINELEEKFKIAEEKSYANYGFFIGATNNNFEEICKIDSKIIPGIKIFLGSSTGNMLVDNEDCLDYIFKNANIPIAIHAEEENIVKQNLINAKKEYGENILPSHHPIIRNHEACFNSSSKAINRAKKFGTRLHILHLSTGIETELLSNTLLYNKNITAEVCVHHLWFCDKDYEKYGNLIKWNPAIKGELDRQTLRDALKNGLIDIVATDHAPHSFEEKQQTYLNAPSGGPLVQHSLPAMLELYHQGIFSLEMIVEKMCHNPAILFGIEKRGFIEQGYFADLTLIDINKTWTVNKENILYKCNWSPFEGTSFKSKIISTWVNGKCVYNNNTPINIKNSMSLVFNHR